MPFYDRDLPRPRPIHLASSITEAKSIIKDIGGYPVFLRPRFPFGFASAHFISGAQILRRAFPVICESSVTRDCLVYSSIKKEPAEGHIIVYSPKDVDRCVESLGGVPVSLWPVNSPYYVSRFFVWKREQLLPQTLRSLNESPCRRIVVKKINIP